MAKASDNVFPKLIFSSGSAPATPSAGQGKVYEKSSDKKLYFKNEDGTEYDLTASGGGTTSSNNEATASALADATAAGDSGSRADHFPGSSLTGWTTVNVSGAATVTVGNSVLNLASSGDSYVHKAFTPSGAFTVEARVALAPGTNGDLGIFVTDYTGASSLATNGNSITASLFWNSGSSKFQMDATKIAGGARTSIGSAVDVPAATWVYLRLTRDGSNNVRAFYSIDRARWIAFGSAAALTFTPARIAIRASTANGGSVDFIDVAA